MRFTKLIFLATLIIGLSSCVASSGKDELGAPESTSSSQSTSATAETRSSPTTDAVYVPANSESPAQNVPLPDLPSMAKHRNKDGATEFAKYYFELINFTVESNDSTPLKNVTTRECQVCGNTLIDPADRAKRNGTWRVGGLHHATILDSYMSANDKAVVTVSFTSDSGYLYNKSRKTPEEFTATKSTVMSLGLEYDKKWRVYTALVGSD
ncbi:DUF6318 family protein [Glutamicibacter sp. TV12E]|uniref:DUF6318 family protein n=1 Tax=Glutamicibacter sp. TV12E TaxID=3446362 RepID=UPI004034D8A1